MTSGTPSPLSGYAVTAETFELRGRALWRREAFVDGGEHWVCLVPDVVGMVNSYAPLLEALKQSDAELAVVEDLLQHAGTDPLGWIDGIRRQLQAALALADGRR